MFQKTQKYPVKTRNRKNSSGYCYCKITRQFNNTNRADLTGLKKSKKKKLSYKKNKDTRNNIDQTDNDKSKQKLNKRQKERLRKRKALGLQRLVSVPPLNILYLSNNLCYNHPSASIGIEFLRKRVKVRPHVKDYVHKQQS